MPKLVFLSDTHLRHDFQIPEGDILIHCGDLTMSGSVPEIAKAANWLKGVKVGHGFKHVILIPGNHDWLAEKHPEMMYHLFSEADCTYLQHEQIVLSGIKFFGSGYTPRFFDWALNVDRGEALARLWTAIPDDVEILITHGPPKGRLDSVRETDSGGYGEYMESSMRWITKHVGCDDLASRIKDLKKLKIHSFGHIHRPGVEVGADGIVYINASTCNEQYVAVHKPITIDWPIKES